MAKHEHWSVPLGKTVQELANHESCEGLIVIGMMEGEAVPVMIAWGSTGLTRNWAELLACDIARKQRWPTRNEGLG